MNARGAIAWGVAVWLAGAGTLAAANAGPRVELPPMMVEESVSGVPWLYVNAGGTEFLSRCSAGTTRSLVEGWLDKLQQVRALVPEEFLGRMDPPSIFVLYSQDLQQTVSAEIQRELQAAGARSGGVDIAPSMRLADRDLHGSIAYIDEGRFDAAGLSIAPSHVRFLVQIRVPALPAWLVDGVERAWRRTDFVQHPITLNPLVWENEGESDALGADPLRPRAVLPASELFANEARRAVETRYPRRVATRASTQELLVRWAWVTGGPVRDAFWKLAAQSAEGPITEEQFEANFGFDYAELRDRLSDYLPKAVRETAWISPGKIPAVPDFTVEKATPNQVARVRGEWERLAIGHVRRRLPQVVEPYIAQARRTLRRAYDAGDRDPRLLATMGLCEIDAGAAAAARPWFEAATAGGVVRPRAYYELAWLRWTELPRAAGGAATWPFAQLAPVIAPLRQALPQAPALPEIYALLADAWTACELAPNREEWAELERGARLFAGRPAVGLPIARTLARHGRKAEATALLAAGAAFPMDEETRAGVDKLRAELAAAEER